MKLNNHITNFIKAIGLTLLAFAFVIFSKSEVAWCRATMQTSVENAMKNNETFRNNVLSKQYVYYIEYTTENGQCVLFTNIPKNYTTSSGSQYIPIDTGDYFYRYVNGNWAIASQSRIEVNRGTIVRSIVTTNATTGSVASLSYTIQDLECYPTFISYSGNVPLVELVYYGDTTSRNNTVFIPRFNLNTDPSSDVINSDHTWNDNYTVDYKLTFYVASHEYANAIYNAYNENGKDINNVRFQNALAQLLQTNMPLGESEQTVSGTIHPYSSSDFVTSPETLFYRDFSAYALISPITVSSATDRDKNALAPYLYRIKNTQTRLKTSSSYGKTTVVAYSVAQNFLTMYTFTDEQYDDRNSAIEDALAESQDRYAELLKEYNAYVIDRQRLDAFTASESWYDIDIGKTAMQVIDIFDSMVDVVGSFADYTTMFMAWIPVSVLRLFIACLILNCIVALYHALRG